MLGEITFPDGNGDPFLTLGQLNGPPTGATGRRNCGPCDRRKAATAARRAGALAAQPNLLFDAADNPVRLANIYRGRSAFLICGGPSFAALDQSKLRQPGILTMGVNNSAKTFRPNLWTFVDGADHFLRSIFLDPTILKFAPLAARGGRLFDSNGWRYTEARVPDCPGVMFYGRHCGWKAETFLNEPTICWGNDDKSGGARSVMLVAVRLLHHLGVRRIFLLGCDFQMSGTQKYHFEQDRCKSSIAGNNGSYAALNKRFAEARPIFERAGLRIFNCNPASGLTAFDTVDFNAAVAMALAEFGNIDTAAERTAGLYESRKPPVKKELPKNKSWNAKPVIPKLAHVVWLGSPLPPTAQKNIARFRELHPDWKVNIVIDLPADLPEDFRRACLTVDQLCQRADLIRLWLVWKQGGFYFDADVYPLRSFEPLRHYSHVFWWNTQANKGRVANAIFAAGPGSKPLAWLTTRASEIIARSTPRARCAFGPDLFGEMAVKIPGIVNIQPCHQIAPYQARGSSFNLMKLKPEDQELELSKISDRFVGDVWPFALHHQGIPEAEMPPGDGRSSWTKPLGRGDAILRRLPPQSAIGNRLSDIPNAPVLRGAEVGVCGGRLSAYLLAHRADLHLTMVDAWRDFGPDSRYAASRDDLSRWKQPQHEASMATALRGTEFAKARRCVVRALSTEGAASVSDGSLDFVFLDAGHGYEDCRDDIAAWLPKLKPGGLICGHDIDNRPAIWGVRRAVEEAASRLGAKIEVDRDWTWFIRLPTATQ